MSVITINQEDIADYYGDLVPAYARLFAHKDFRTSEGIFVAKGSADDNSGFYQQFTASLVGTKIRIANGTAYSTTDALVNTNTAYSLVVYDANGTEIKRVFSSIHIPPVTPTTWGAIEIFSKGKQQRYPSTYLDSLAIIALLSQYQSNILGADDPFGPAWNGSLAVPSKNTVYDAFGTKQDTLVAGTNIKTINGVSPLGAGNLAISGGVETFVSTPTNLSNLITTALANPTVKYDAIVDATVAVTSANTIPANVFFESKNGGVFVKSFTGALHFDGIGLADPESKSPIFSGFAIGDVTFTGATADLRPSSISTELWDTGNSSLTDRLDRVNAAFGSNFVKIVCHPRTITGHVDFPANKEIFFMPGDYLNTHSGGFAAFQLNSFTHFHGTHAARLHESVGAQGTAVVTLYQADSLGTYDSIIVENLTFYGEPFAMADGLNTTVILYNAKNSSIRNNVFYRTNAYCAFFGGSGNNGNHADNCDISGNRFIGIGSQVCGCVNGRNIRITDNVFDQRSSNNGTTYTVIDIEPNANTDIVEDILIDGNYIDARDYTPGPFTIVAANVNTTAHTITIPNHGLGEQRYLTLTTTGTLPSPLAPATNYWVHVVDKDTIQLTATAGGTPILLSTTGSGTATATISAKYLYGILIQSDDAPSGKNVTISNNTIIGGDIYPYIFGTLQTGIGVSGVYNGSVFGNTVVGGIQGPYSISGRFIDCYDNKAIQTAGGSGINDQILVFGVADSFIRNNIIQKTQNGVYAGIFEGEVTFPVSTSGTTITLNAGFDSFVNRFYDYFPGLNFFFNGVVGTFATFTDIDHMEATVSLGTVGQKTFTSGNVDATANTITITGHGYNTGCKIDLTTLGVLPTFSPTIPVDALTGHPLAYVIKIDANTIKIASSLDNAIANTALDITAVGSGTSTVTPMMESRFSNNRYSDNYALDGITLDIHGSSQIISTMHDRESTAVADANYSATSATGILRYTSLTAARTVNLPNAATCKGKEITIKDGVGAAAANHIIANPYGTQLIEGAISQAVGSNYGLLTIKSTGTAWVIVASIGTIVSGGAPLAMAYVDYDPANLAGLSNNDPISTLTDAVAGRDATQSGSNRPTFVTNAINTSLPAIAFAGASAQYFNLPDLSALTEGSIHIIIKLDADPPVANDGLWTIGPSGAAGTRFPFITDSTIYDQFGTTVRKATVNPTPSLASWRVYSVTSKNGNWTSYIDGTQIFTTATNTAGFDSAPTLGLSKEGGSSFYLQGKIARVRLFNAWQDSTAVAAEAAALIAAYGL